MASPPATGSFQRLLNRVAEVKPHEVKALLWSFAYFLFLLGSYYVLRPLRDEMGVAVGVGNLPWLFTATFLALIPCAPLLAAIVARLPRAKFIPVIYQFFAANIVIFWLLLTFDVAALTVMKVYFVWVSVVNVFVVSVFWSFMTDIFNSEQSKRLFGFIGAGGSIGTLVAPLLVKFLAEPLGPVNLLIAAFILLELAVLCARGLEKVAAELKTVAPQAATTSKAKPKSSDQVIGGGMFDGFVLLFRSPYLGGIGLWVLLLSLANTFLYFQQQELVAAFSDDPSQRLKIFANIDLWTSVLTIAMQVLATGRLISRFGTGPAAAFLPLVFALGFVLLALHPMLAIVTLFQAVQRACNFGVANLARESLWTVVSREEKFKAKNIIDGAVFRGADMLNGWLFTLLRGLMSLTAVSMTAAAIAVGWLLLSLGLGRAQERRAALDSPAGVPVRAES